MDNSYQDEYEKAFIEAVSIGSGMVIIAHPSRVEFIAFAKRCGFTVLSQEQVLTEENSIKGNSFDTLIVDDITLCIKDWTYPIYKAEPFVHDKPVKKIPIKQAPRQSFRQSMRSVNRNR